METRHCGGFEYNLERKRVKNINMRISADGKINISAPRHVAVTEIDSFVLRKSDWIISAVKQRQKQSEADKAPLLFSKEECLKELCEISDKIFPLFADILNKQRPIIKVRRMKTRWGVCHIQKRSITLNMRLMDKPYAAREYVVMHEYVHFIHPDHGKGFYKTLSALMPDYKERRGLLK